MRKILCGLTALSCALIFAPLAPAMHSSSPDNNDFISENLCAPNFDAESNQATFLGEHSPELFSTMDFDQLENVRIELLERGFNPGFAPERGTAVDYQLMEALAQFQAEYGLAVTGQVDAATLAALSVPTQKLSPKMSEQEIQRAKPSEKSKR
jgi:murein L,D-transpeptidase YcbB/YkuD